MQRRMFTLMQQIGQLGTQQQQEVISYLKTHFFPQFHSPLDYTALLSLIHPVEHEDHSALFEQGEVIHTYYFLLSGTVLLEKQGPKNNQRHMVDGETVIGQFFYDTAKKRQFRAEVHADSETCLLFWVDKKAYHALFQAQIDQYLVLKQQVATFCDLTQDTLETSGLYQNIGVKKYRIGDDLLPNRQQQMVYIITKGQCLLNLAGKQQALLQIGPDDCINLQQYFTGRSNPQRAPPYRYRAATSELQVIGLSFEFLDNLPTHFISRLAFIHNCHSQSMQPHSLPLLIKEHSLSSQVIKNRNSHKTKKSQSILDVDKQNVDSEAILNFRKQYCLGYFGKFAPVRDRGSSLLKQKIGLPKGYFDLSSCSRPARVSVPELPRKDWAQYVSILKDSPTRQMKESQQKKQRDSTKRLQSIFRKYEQRKFIQTFQKTDKKLVKEAKLKQFIFPSRRKILNE